MLKTILNSFSAVQDPGDPACVSHKLGDMLAIAFIGTAVGCLGWKPVIVHATE
jgi:hypothetical protein